MTVVTPSSIQVDFFFGSLTRIFADDRVIGWVRHLFHVQLDRFGIVNMEEQRNHPASCSTLSALWV